MSGCAEDTPSTFGDFHFTTWHFLGFPLYRPALFEISILPPGTMGIPTFPPSGKKKVAFQRFNCHQKLNFWCRRD